MFHTGLLAKSCKLDTDLYLKRVWELADSLFTMLRYQVHAECQAAADTRGFDTCMLLMPCAAITAAAIAERVQPLRALN